MSISHSISLVVLPLTNISQNNEYDYFCDGITDAIIQALSSIEELRVISKTSSFHFKGKSLSLAEVAEKLKVNHVLEGSVRIVEKQIKVSLNLVDAKSDFSLWSQAWKRELSQLFDLEDEICLAVADQLREHAGHLAVDEQLVIAPTPTIAAYEHYLKGKKLFNKWNPQDVYQAIAELEEAEKLDPKLVDVHITLADAYSFLAVTGFAPQEESLQKSHESLQKAKKIDPNSPELNYLLANDAFFTEANFAEAMRLSLKALQSKPTYIDSHRFLCFLYLLCGKNEKAKEHLFFAKSIDPLGAETSFFEGYYYYRIEQFEKSQSIMESLLQENPKNIPALMIQCYLLILQNQVGEVEKIVEQTAKELFIPDERLGLETLILLEKQDPEFKESFNKLKENSKKQTSKQADAYLYMLYARQGLLKEAFKTVELIFTQASSIVLLHFGDPLAKKAQESTEFKSLQKRIYQIEKPQKKKSSKNSSALDTHLAEAALQKVQQHLEDEQSYLNPQLSLRLLAKDVDLTPNQLSWLLNEKAAQNFNEFINQYRIQHFKQLAGKAENAHISIVGLAYESGFNSKSVFNSTFKKLEGQTPKAFLSQAQKEF